MVFIYLFIDCGNTSGLNEGLAWVELQLWIFCAHGLFEVISVILFYSAPTRQNSSCLLPRAALTAYSCGPRADLLPLYGK